MSRFVRNLLLILEVVICFAIPASFLLWGLIVLPVWIAGALRGDPTGVMYTGCVSGGIAGIVALVVFVSHLIRDSVPSTASLVCNATLAALGLASVWAVMTDGFDVFDLGWFTVPALVTPTACTIHIVGSVLRRVRQQRVPDRSA